MSSTKPKTQNKQKSQQQIALQQKNEELVKANLQQSITIKKLTQQLVSMKQLELHQLSEFQRSNKQCAQSMQKQQLMRSAQQEHLFKLRQKKQQLEIENGCLNYKLERLNSEYDDYKQLMKQQLDDMKRIYDSEIKKYQTLTGDYQQAINQRKYYLAMNTQLTEDIRQNDENYRMELADKDREKLQTVDFMKKDMYDKAKQLKTTLLTMKREQMNTNTRLTVLQNQQLLEELQYQSKNTEKMLNKNHLLETELTELKKQLQIEKEVNEELAKRTTIAKKIIKTINNNNNGKGFMLEDGEKNNQVNNRKSNYSSQNNKQALFQYQKTVTLLQAELRKRSQEVESKAKQAKKYQKLYEDILPKYEAYFKTQGNLKVVMVQFLRNMLEGQIVGEQDQVEYDISRLKDIHVDQWTKSDIEITVRMLLTFLKPYFTMRYMKAQYLKYTNKTMDMSDDVYEIDDLLKMPKINTSTTEYGNLTTKFNNTTINFRSKINKGKSLSSFGQYLKPNMNKTMSITRKYFNQNKQHSAHMSSKQKEFTLHSILKNIKQQKLIKSQSQHNLTALSTTGNKFISGQESTVQNNSDTNKNNNEKRQNPLLREFTIDNFKTKQTKKLVKSNYRQWGQKINLKQKGSFISGKRINC